MSEHGTGVHTITEEKKNNFHSGRHTNIWKAVNSKPKALVRKTGLQVTQNKETLKRPKKNVVGIT